MLKKNLSIIFIILLILVGGYYFFEKDNKLSQNNSGNICEGLGVSECYNTYGCEYGTEPVGDFGDRMLTSCEKVPQAVIDQSIADKKLCEETGGQWMEISFSTSGHKKYWTGWPACDCDDDDWKTKFVADKGCMKYPYR